MTSVRLVNEFRDPIHQFVRSNNEERRVIDSRPLQRLRYIHQLALTYLVYPGATHRRFEHSLGVMELAGRVFDVVTDPENLHPTIREQMPEIRNADTRAYWRTVLRMAALCHDLGHLPFSHAAESDLLPSGWNHERLTVEVLRSEPMRDLFESLTPPLRVSDVEKIAVGKKELPDVEFSDWEAVLSEIVVGDAFGVDRMDYLLRDSLHCGVAYGRFDHFRLIDTLRVLPKMEESDDGSTEPELGVTIGGLQSAEGLLLARYSMFSQVYLHPVRRTFDIHLKDFLRSYLPLGHFPTDVDEHLDSTDVQVIAAMAESAKDDKARGHEHADRIVNRKHYRVLWSSSPSDLAINPSAGDAVFAAARDQFGNDAVRRDNYSKSGAVDDFPVLTRDDRIESALSASSVLSSIPAAAADYVFIEPTLRDRASEWLRQNRESMLENYTQEDSTTT